MTVRRLALVSMTVSDLDRATAFYTAALGFAAEEERLQEGEAFARLMGVEGARARARTLRLGLERIELLAFEPAGSAYPFKSHSPDLWFQHFAIIVSDMEAAFARLQAAGGFVPISVGGPVVLPASSGGVTAFKFRDPDGHPLELLAFADGGAPEKWRGRTEAGPCLGVDHSAIAVADTGRSEAFYVGMLGLQVSGRSLNKGVEQERLDGTFNAVVEVTGLGFGEDAGPHVELLCYRVPPTGQAIARTARNDDIAATRLVIETADLEGLADEAVEKRMELVSPISLAGMPASIRRSRVAWADARELNKAVIARGIVYPFKLLRA